MNPTSQTSQPASTSKEEPYRPYWGLVVFKDTSSKVVKVFAPPYAPDVAAQMVLDQIVPSFRDSVEDISIWVCAPQVFEYRKTLAPIYK